MKKFYLYGKLGERFGREWSLNVKTVPEGIHAINANIPGFTSHLLYKELEGVNYIISTKPATASSNHFITKETMSSEIESREVHIFPTVAGGAVFIPLGIKVLAKVGVASAKAVVAGTATAGIGLSIGAAVVGATIMIGASMLIGAIVKSLIDIPEMGDPVSTKSYVMNGPENTTRQGVPVPIGYGRLMVGSTVIQSTLRSFDLGRAVNSNMLESFDQMQIYDLIGEGPIEGIVNKQGARTYDLEQGVYINGVPMKNEPKPGDNSAEGSGTYNIVMNESGTPTRLSRGESFERLPLADNNAKITTSYQEMLIGPNPYNGGKRTTIDSAKANEASVITHYISDDYTSKVIFVVSLVCYTQTKNPDHPIGENTLSFGVRMHDGKKFLSNKDPGWSIKWRTRTINSETKTEAKEAVTTHHVDVTGIATSLYKMEVEVQMPKTSNPIESSSSRYIEFVRLTPETKPNEASNNFQSTLSHVIEEKSYQVSYPHSSVVNLSFDSMNIQSTPRRSYHVKLLKVPVPENYTPETRTYSGHWNGLFKGQRDALDTVGSIPDNRKKWTDNPAWIFYDLCTNPRYGLAKYGVGVSEDLIDKWSIYKAAKYCDELVPTGLPAERSWRKFEVGMDSAGKTICSLTIRDKAENDILTAPLDFTGEFGSGYSFKGRKIILKVLGKQGRHVFIEGAIRKSSSSRKSVDIYSPNFEMLAKKGDNNLYEGECVCQFSHPIVEPRFTCDIYLTQFQQALGLFKNLAGIFNGMVSYIDGRVGIVQERDKEAIMLFNNSNISADGFNYTGVDRFNRKTAVKVTYRNRFDDFNQATAYEEDSPAIDRFGYNEAALTGVGISSPSQARRLARFFLYVSQLETEVVVFKCGREGAYLRAGEVIEVVDNNRQEAYSSGRIISLDSGNREATLDRIISKPVLGEYGYEFIVARNQPNETYSSISDKALAGSNATEQDVLIESVKSSQLARFVGNTNSSNKISGLLSKKNFEVDINSQRLTCYNHGLISGDVLLFDSQGSLPEPLLKGFEYTVDEVFDHSFTVKVADSSGSQPVVPITTGTDKIGNEGGLHYFINKNEDASKKELENVALGSAWAISNNKLIQPMIAVEDYLLSNAQIHTLLDGTPSSNPNEVGWAYSNVFKSHYYTPPNTNGWVLVERLHSQGVKSSQQDFGWIFINDQVDMENYSSGFYYMHASLGWVFYWKDDRVHEIMSPVVAHLKNVRFMTGEFGDKTKEGLVFVYVSGTEPSAVARDALVKYLFGSITGFDHVAESNNPRGQWFSFAKKYDPSDLNELTVPELPILTGEIEWTKSVSVSAAEENFNYINPDGTGMIQITIGAGEHSIGESDYVKVYFSGWSGNGVYLAKYLSSEGDSDKYLLIGSKDNPSDLTDAKLIELNRKIQEAPLFSQKFRIKSLKEEDKGIYEVSASEYNPLKFQAIENNINIEKPRAFIPPQADMSIPDAPTDLELIDITFRAS